MFGLVNVCIYNYRPRFERNIKSFIDALAICKYTTIISKSFNNVENAKTWFSFNKLIMNEAKTVKLLIIIIILLKIYLFL